MKDETPALIDATDVPRTVASLTRDLLSLGVLAGMDVLVHTSLSSIGWIAGGPHAVLLALTGVVTDKGSIMMPTQTGHLSDPEEWRAPPVPETWWQVIRDETPAFDPERTPTRGMGIINETFRSWPDVRRSDHPHASFAAWGRNRDFLIQGHALEMQLGETSPLARLYDLDGQILFLGTGHANNTSFHLGEYRLPDPPMTTAHAPIVRNGVREWTSYQDVKIDDSDFPEIGKAFEKENGICFGKVGNADCRLFSVRAAVDFAQAWIAGNRGA